ncbi:YdcF family protein [Sphingomonas montanisoli]|nr:YdcF family protein [Sphingomonas montanisoli]
MIVRIIGLGAVLWMAGFLIFALFLPQPAPDEVVTDGIVVMTGASGRIERGIKLLEARRARRLLVSGVDRRVKPHEFAKQFKAPVRLMDCCIDLGQESVDTRSNATEASDWVKANRYRSIRLITSDWHMTRGRFDLSDAIDGVTIVPDAVPSEPGLVLLVREYDKYLLRRVAALVGI